MKPPQRLAQFDIDAGGRLVEHDHRRPVHQRLRHQHAALHAARELAHVGVGLVGQAQVGQQLVDPGVVVAHAEVAALDAQRLAHAEEGVEHQFLRHDAERTCARRRSRRPRRGPSPRTLPAAGARQAGQDRDQRGLAGAVGAEQAEELALLDVEAHAVERAHVAARARIGLGRLDRSTTAGMGGRL